MPCTRSLDLLLFRIRLSPGPVSALASGGDGLASAVVRLRALAGPSIAGHLRLVLAESLLRGSGRELEFGELPELEAL